ncbi:MAG TPA: hypothetical protein VGV85_13410, partial [Longimicrobiaceae bacterium]|nr:hypothetical protein [Longimicrobiaceae bacterium]
MIRVRPARLLLPLLLACGAAPAAAQRDTAATGALPAVDVGVQPDTVTVGDRFVVLLRVQAPPGARVEPPARLDSTPELHPVGARIDRADAAARVAGFGYPMVAWRPGALPARSAAVRVAYPDGRVATLRVPLRLPFVRSVLPTDTSRVEPRGPRDVLGPDRDRRLILFLVLLALLLLAPAAVFARRWLRKRLARGANASAVDPRARALATLDRARKMRLVETEEWKPFYTLTSEALRGYLEALSPRWGADLTTEELARAMEASDVGGDDVRTASRLLAEADAVKFARVGSTAEAAERHWRQAREWVESFEVPAVEGEEDAVDVREAVEVAG